MQKILAEQHKTMKSVETLQRTNNVIQLAELYEQRKTDKNTEIFDVEIKKLNKTIEESMKGKTGDGLNSNIIRLFKEVQKQTEGMRKLTKPEVKGITDQAMGRRQYRGVAERLGGVKENVKDFFTMRGFLDKTGIVKRGTGGIVSDALDKREEKQNYIKERMKMDPTKNLKGEAGAAKAFAAQFDKQQEIQKDMRKNEAALKKMKDLGFKEEQIDRSPEGKRKKELATELAKVDPRVRPEGFDPKTGMVSEKKSKASATSNADMTEAQMENSRIQTEQLGLLSQIAENTAPAKGGSGGGGGDGGGGIMAGIGAGLKAIGGGLKGLGEGAGKGIQAFLEGLAKGLAALCNPATLVGLAAAALGIMAIGKALEMAAPFMEAFAPVLIKVADVIQNVFIAAIEKLPDIIKAVGDVVMGIISTISDAVIAVIDAVTSSIERLSQIDGGNLLAVGAGLAAIAAGMVAFGAANAVAGVGNLVGGFLSAVSGQKSPVDQILALGDKGQNIEKAGIGVEKLASGLQVFSTVDPEKIKAIAALPTEKIAAMGAAMGNAGQVYAKSGENAGAAVKPAGGNQTNVVNAPVSNVSKQSNVIRAPIRNRDSSAQEYMRSRYA
jgi:hypothetical protein